MSNTTKVIIAAVIIAILGATSIFIIGQNREQNKAVNTQSSPAISSVKSLAVSSSVQSQVVLSSISTATSSIAIVNSPKSEITLKDTNIELLNSNNPPQYIKDYLVCKSKQLTNKDNKVIATGIFTSKNNEIEYQCPPNKECPEMKYLIFNKLSNAWECNSSTDGERGSCFTFEINFSKYANSKIDFASLENLKNKLFIEKNSFDAGQNCIIFNTQSFTDSEKILISKIIPSNIKLIIYQNN